MILNDFISAGCQQKNGFDPKILCWGRWCHRLSRETAGGRCEDLHCENATRLQTALSQAWKYKPQSVPLVWMSCHVLCSAIVLPTEPLVGLVDPWQSSTLAWDVDPASPSCKSNHPKLQMSWDLARWQKNRGILTGMRWKGANLIWWNWTYLKVYRMWLLHL